MFKNPFFMLRKTHRREFKELSKTYRHELDIADKKASTAQHELVRRQLEWAQMIDRLTYYKTDDGEHMLSSMDSDQKPHNLELITIHNHFERDCTVFTFAITNFLIDRARSSLLEPQLYYLKKLIAQQLEHQVWEALTKDRTLGV